MVPVRYQLCRVRGSDVENLDEDEIARRLESDAFVAWLCEPYSLEGELLIGDAAIADDLTSAIQRLCFEAVEVLAARGASYSYPYFTCNAHATLASPLDGTAISLSGDDIPVRSFSRPELLSALYACGLRYLGFLEELSRRNRAQHDSGLAHLRPFAERARMALTRVTSSEQSHPDATGDRARILREICADPDATAPRLVYADWLLLRGDARGELIVLQCAAPEADEAATEHERDLIERHRTDWLGDLADLDGVVWDRGFVSELAAPIRWLVHRLAAVCETEPLLERLVPLPPPNKIFDDALDALASMPCLAQLRALDLRRCATSPRALETLVASPHLAGLRELRLSLAAFERPWGGRYISRLLRRMTANPALAGLRHLHIVECGLDDRALVILRELPALEKLTLLAEHSLTGAGLTTLLDVPSLRELSVSRPADLSPEVEHQLRTRLTAVDLDATDQP